MPGGRLARIRGVCVCVCVGGGRARQMQDGPRGVHEEIQPRPQGAFPGLWSWAFGTRLEEIGIQERGLYDFTFLLYFQRNAFIAFGSIK